MELFVVAMLEEGKTLAGMPRYRIDFAVKVPIDPFSALRSTGEPVT